MKPRDLLLWRIEEFIFPIMEDHGFKFAKSGMYFRRRVGEFAHRIDFFSSYKNEEDRCGFQTGWSIESPTYRAWYQKTWGKKSNQGSTVFALIDNGIPGWRDIREPRQPQRLQRYLRRSKKMPISHTLVNGPADEIVMGMLQTAFTTVGIPYLEKMSAWDAAAEYYKDTMGYWPHVCDLYMIAGEDDKARRFLEQCLEAAQGSDDINARYVLEDLERYKAPLLGD